ncbi:hypothetical protein NEFER03_0552 [Nematocida sp. LUAm3]|nr:hypothetical protein NEFER03_0552 [Nematocida sp. LUAm3]KAI5175519.1 hypothetical protein NEFER02_1425 [Nematocida sp. LUAm2]KAI5178451.1 hypothetical protein NEFER01_1598 [Nematocida sp. LUAm1]
MNLGLSVDALIEERKQKKERRKEKERIRPKKDTKQEEPKDLPAKQKKLSKAERTLLLDKTASQNKDDILEISENERKELLKMVVKILNTIPYEPAKTTEFPESGNPHLNAGKPNPTKLKRFSKPPRR